MPLQLYTNNVAGSDIKAIYTYLEAPMPRLFVEYKDNTYGTHRYDQMIDILNKSRSEPSMALLESLREKIAKDSDNIVSKDESTGIYFWNDIDKYKSLYSVIDERPALTEDEQKLLHLAITDMPWYRFQDNFDKIVKAAHDMINENPGSRIFSLGQSPAWIIKAAEYISALKHSNQIFGYIPFSGRFYKVINEFDEDIVFNPVQFRPTTQQEEFYHNILDQLDLNPKIIVESYQSHNTKTAIMEFKNTGNGLASFLSVLFSWANQEGISAETLKSALDVVLLVSCKEDAKKSLLFDSIHIECKNQVIEEILTLANGVDQGPYSDRLIPNYPYSKWGIVPESIAENADFIKILINKIQVAGQGYVSFLSTDVEDANSTTLAEAPIHHEVFLDYNDQVNVSGDLTDQHIV